MTDEAQIQADIEALRVRIADTQELYREVCAILFFRYGITPTANKLYQYVRKGSMSAPALALSKFWEELREKSRVRIEHPDLPEAVKASASELVGSLWAQAQAAAQESLSIFRAEAQATVLEARAETKIAEDGQVEAQRALDQVRTDAKLAADRNLGLERDLAAERAAKEALLAQLEASGHQRALLESALAEARRDFAGELEKLRHALNRSEERCEATEKRALLEIDRERIAATRAHKEIAQLRQAELEATNRNRTELAELQRELAEYRQRFGVGEGTMRELRVANQQQAEQLDALRKILSEKDTQIALLQHDLDTSQSSQSALQEELQRLRIVQSPRSRTKRPRSIT